jgi:glycogen(starch) synthase
VLERADYVTAVAGSLLRQACELVPQVEGKSCLVPNPVVLDAHARSSMSPASGLPAPSSPYILFVGRLEAMKDVATLLDAYHLACEESSFAHGLVIVGEGELLADLERRARKGRGAQRVVFLGRRAHSETLALIRGADALVVPSKSSEGCPNVVLEAMALGTPVIVSDLEALREAVGDGEAGAVFARGSARGLQAEIVALTADPSRRQRYMRAARARLEAKHRLETVLDEYERIYESLVVRPRRP